MNPERIPAKERTCEEHLKVALMSAKPDRFGDCECNIKHGTIHPNEFYYSEITIDLEYFIKKLKQKNARSVTFVLRDKNGNAENHYTVHTNMKWNEHYIVKQTMEEVRKGLEDDLLNYNS